MFVDVDPNDTDSMRLAPQDVGACREIREWVSARPFDRRVRAEAMARIMRLADADDWLWCYSAIEPLKLHPINLNHQYSGIRTAKEGFIYLARVLCVSGVPPENQAIHDAILEYESLTFRERRVMPRKYWESSERRGYARRSGFDDVLYSLWRTERAGEAVVAVGLTLWRRTGRPDFSVRDAAVVHHVMGTTPALVAPGRNRAMARILGRLSPILRVSMAYLVNAEPIETIADATQRPIETIRRHAKELAGCVTGTASRSMLQQRVWGTDDASLWGDSSNP